MQKRTPSEGSYQHLDAVVIACLQGRRDVDSAVAAILASHRREQVQAIFLGEGERYRRFNRARFTDLVEQLRHRGVLW